jgi:hypothetical protein
MDIRPTIDVDIPIHGPKRWKGFRGIDSQKGNFAFRLTYAERNAANLPYPARLGMPDAPGFQHRLDDWKLEEVYKLDQCVGTEEYASCKEKFIHMMKTIHIFITKYWVAAYPSSHDEQKQPKENLHI